MSFVLTYDAIAKRIDHSLLGPALTTAELEEGCRLAVRYGVASVCIKPAGGGAGGGHPQGLGGGCGDDDRVSARRSRDGSEGL